MTVSPPRAQVVAPPRAHFQVDNFGVMTSTKRCAMMTMERMIPTYRPARAGHVSSTLSKSAENELDSTKTRKDVVYLFFVLGWCVDKRYG